MILNSLDSFLTHLAQVLACERGDALVLEFLRTDQDELAFLQIELTTLNCF